MAYATIQQLIDPCQLEVLCGQKYLQRTVSVADLNRPGLGLAGYLEHFDNLRIQVTGMTELAFLSSLSPDLLQSRWQALFATKFPCLIVTRGLDFPHQWLRWAEAEQVPVLRTHLPTTRFISQLTDYLENRLAPCTTVHGDLIDVHGVGVLITGESGIGKSETVLELLYRRHRLVADDVVDVTKRGDHVLIGTSPDLVRYLIEVRGLGIMDVKKLFGAGSVLLSLKIDIVIQLDAWQKDKYYDRWGLDEEKEEILGISLPKFIIPVLPGRNLAAIVDVAAMNYRQKMLGSSGL
ncbi:hpr serine kinase n terminus [Lucifera butyrica]|uniref:HPr kinase/phosphorylase n=1 Tax=Lucifera butyrica TaxID=1351585 RepID=A0A498R9E2_9FIRM|nr:HPr(Ser) kinase/phosphatase [Lucifera butyrica]VBB07615.1 hpr serine kinase n terminus [Lucifera butyrica]